MRTWLTTKEASIYARIGYDAMLEKIKAGSVRSVRAGRKFLTTTEWVDDYFLGFEDTGILKAGKKNKKSKSN